MVYLILISALAGSFLTLLLQFWLLYRRKPEPVPRTEQYVNPVLDPLLRDYFNTHTESACQPQQQDAPAATTSKQQESASTKQQETASKAETCNFLNAIFLFLFRELRNTPLVRQWVAKKIKVEFEELLQTKTAGRLLEGLSLRDISLGNSLPLFKTAKFVGAVVCNENEMPEELNFEVDVEYNGGFHLAIDVDLVFGKSAYLFVKMTRVVGRLNLQFTRIPFTHWSFSFLEDPLIDFEVKSQFEGRPMPQLTSVIVNQLKKVIKRKHTLPNYKIRFKPFFPFQVQPTVKPEDPDLCIQDTALIEGRLKVTLVECSRVFIFGSYDREASIHCTLELSSTVWKEKSRSSIKTVELVKGNSQSVGLTFRQVQATEGDATGHVTIETVTPNSPAAVADLQRGDRLIAIGGVKVTSSVQILKLIKQAGDRVLVFYERPVGHQNQQGASLQDGFSQEDSNYMSQLCQQNYEEDIASVTSLESCDNKDVDSEFEEIVYDVKSTNNEIKEETVPATNQSPKRPVTSLATKPPGTVSPVPNRKANLATYQPPLKSQQKETTKLTSPKSTELQDTAQPPSRPLQGPSNKPPVPPRPQHKLTLPCSETLSLPESSDSASEKPERPPPPSNNGEKLAEKNVTKYADQFEDVTVPKQSTGKQEPAKEKVSDHFCSTKDNVEDCQVWESSEIAYRNRYGRWTKASCVFEVESHHKYLNVGLWCKDPFKQGGLICLGHVSIKLEEIALECLCVSSMEYQTTFRVNAPELKAMVSRTAVRNLSNHKGFNENLCYGDITVNFKYLKEGESENVSVLFEKERECTVQEEASVLQKEEPYLSQVVFTENKHSFQDTQFQNPTWCEYCKKKVWTKAASQCILCAYVCHKKCQEKCLAEYPFCVAPERRADLETKSTLNRTTGLTRHILNTSSRLLNLRQVPKTRLVEQGSDLAEPSPKQTPNTSDNESSDTETYSGNSPSKQPANTGTKLVRKEGGLDDSVFIAVKEIGRDLYRGLPTDERFQKLELMLDKLQNEIDQELEHNNSLLKEKKETTDARKKSLISAALSKSGERLQALTLLMIHYRAGIEDLEALESTSSEQQTKKITKSIEEPTVVVEGDDNEIVSQMDPQTYNSISEEEEEEIVHTTETFS